jgi:nucleotide-binding universal stress UspA family protein
MAGLVVIGYDGSGDARRAVDVAAHALRPDTALVLNVWAGSLAAAHVPVPLGVPSPPTPEEEAELEQAARRIADEGAARARDAGLPAEGTVRRGATPDEIAKALFDLADDRDAALVIVGRRGMSRLKAAVLGSVSDAAVRSGRGPVLVVPADE